MRKIARTDANQTEIVEALRAAGAHVCSLAQVGGGCPDLLAGYRGHWFVLECKDGNKPPSQRKLTKEQIKWHNEARATVHVVHSVEQALEAIGAINRPPALKLPRDEALAIINRSIGLDIV